MQWDDFMRLLERPDGKDKIVAALRRDPALAQCRNGDGVSLLHMARKPGGGPEVAQLLVELGVDPDAATKNGYTPLLWAAAWAGKEKHAVGVMDVLIGAGAALTPACEGGVTPLMKAAGAGSAAAVSLLLKHGADLEARDAQGKTVFDLLPRNLHPDAMPVHDEISRLLHEARDERIREKENAFSRAVYDAVHGGTGRDIAPMRLIFRRQK
jgi:ankyrin repeat protein